MTLFECYNDKKGALQAQLRNAKSLAETQKTLSDFFDMLQYAYAEDCRLDALRSACAFMVGAVKSAFPLLECVSDVRVWETKGEAAAPRKKGVGRRAAGGACVLLGLLVVALTVFIYLSRLDARDTEKYRGGLYAVAAGCVLLAAGGFLLAGRAPKLKSEQQVTVLASADDVVRRLTAVVLQMDKSLSVIETDEINRKKREQTEFTAEQLELFGQLLEGKYSGSDELTVESVAELERYLHNCGVELLSYEEGKERYFDLLPSGDGDRTLRPALLRDGRTLRKGLATQGLAEAAR